MTVSRTTRPDLDAIEARLKAATPGPWIITLGSGLNQCTAIQREDPKTGEMTPVADCLPDWALDAMGGKDHLPTMHFLLEAPTDITALLAYVRVLEADTLRLALVPSVRPDAPWVVSLDESDRQMTLLALAELSLRRPGWLTALRRVAMSHAGAEMFERFRATSADLVRKAESMAQPRASELGQEGSSASTDAKPGNPTSTSLSSVPTEAMIEVAYEVLRPALNHRGDYACVERAMRAALAEATQETKK